MKNRKLMINMSRRDEKQKSESEKQKSKGEKQKSEGEKQKSEGRSTFSNRILYFIC